MLPRSKHKSKYYFVIILTGLCLYLGSVFFIRIKEDFNTSSGGVTTTIGGGSGNPVFQCGTSGRVCQPPMSYCLITERELPSNTFDQNLVFNTNARYVKIFPPATSGDAVVSISQIAIYNEKGTNIAVNKPATGTTNGAAASITTDGTLTPRAWPNVFSTSVQDRNAAALTIDLGSVQMITSIRYIGRSDCCDEVDKDKPPRNIGVRFRLYRSLADTPTTGTCTLAPEIVYPAGISEDEKPIIAPIITSGFDGDKALQIYRRVRGNQRIFDGQADNPTLILTGKQTVQAYADMYMKNLVQKVNGWKIYGSWTTGSNIVTRLSGALPTVGMKIASSSSDGDNAVNQGGTIAQSFPVDTTVTNVEGNKITLSNVSTRSGTNTAIKFKPTITPSNYNASTFLFKSVKTMSTWPNPSATTDMLNAMIEYKAFNSKTGRRTKKNPDGTPYAIKDTSGNILSYDTVEFTDDGTEAAFNLIMNTTKPPIQDPNSGNTATTSATNADGYAIPTPPDTFQWGTDSVTGVPTTPFDIRSTPYDTNNEVTLIGVNTFNTSSQSQVSLVAAQSAQISAGSGNRALQQDENSIDGVRRLTDEFYLLGDSNSFSSRELAQGACTDLSGTLADFTAFSTEVTAQTTVTNLTNGTGSYQKRPQWHEYGWFANGTRAFPTQQVSLQLPLGGGSWSRTISDKVPAGVVVTATTGNTAGAVCRGKKPSMIPITRSFVNKSVIINSKGQYLRLWAPVGAAFSLNCTLTITYNTSIAPLTSSVPTSFTITGSTKSTYLMDTTGARKQTYYWETNLGAQVFISTITTNSTDTSYRVEFSKSLRASPYYAPASYTDKDHTQYMWNDKAAFNPICPTGLSDMICKSPDTGLLDLMCIPLVPDIGTSLPTGTIDVISDALNTQSPELDKSDGRIYGSVCGRIIKNAPNKNLHFRHAKCPMDCDPGSTWDSTKKICKYNMKDCNAWISLQLMELKYTDYFPSASNTTSVTSLNVSEFDGEKYKNDYNSKIIAGNKNYIDYLKGKMAQAAARYFTWGFVKNTIPECPHDATEDEKLTCVHPPCAYGYVSPLGNCECYRETFSIGGGVSKEPITCPDGWTTLVATCNEPTGWNDKCVWWGLYWTGCSTGGRIWGRYNADNHNCRSSHPDYIDGLCYRSCGPGWEHIVGAPTECNRVGAANLTATYRRFRCDES